jgi:dipeptidyl aminopeptidase/acylaminoacyl peptidase
MSRARPIRNTLALVAALAAVPVARGASQAIPRDTVPVLFAEGIVSTGDNEFSTAFSPDGRTVYWTVSAPNVFVIPFVILSATRTARGWSAPRVAPFSGTGFSDADPAISPDGRRIFFMSRRPATGAAQRPDFDIWVFDVTTSTTTRVDEVNSETMDLFPSVTSDGTLYFTSDRDGGFGGADIYRSRFVDGRYATPENIGPVVNSAHGESNVFVAPDESYLVFSGGGRPDSKGGTDLYIAERSAEESWGVPRPLRYANTEWDDYAPTVSPDGRLLYFTSRRPRVRAAAGARLTYEELRARLRAAGNGNADVYTIPFDLAAGRNSVSRDAGKR